MPNAISAVDCGEDSIIFGVEVLTSASPFQKFTLCPPEFCFKNLRNIHHEAFWATCHGCHEWQCKSSPSLMHHITTAQSLAPAGILGGSGATGGSGTGPCAARPQSACCSVAPRGSQPSSCLAVLGAEESATSLEGWGSAAPRVPPWGSIGCGLLPHPSTGWLAALWAQQQAKAVAWGCCLSSQKCHFGYKLTPTRGILHKLLMHGSV